MCLKFTSKHSALRHESHRILFITQSHRGLPDLGDPTQYHWGGKILDNNSTTQDERKPSSFCHLKKLPGGQGRRPWITFWETWLLFVFVFCFLMKLLVRWLFKFLINKSKRHLLLSFYRRRRLRSPWCWLLVPSGFWMWLGKEWRTAKTTAWCTAKVSPGPVPVSSVALKPEKFELLQRNERGPRIA